MPSKQEIMAWDPLVRILHWCLVLAFLIAFVTEDEWMRLHSMAGYTVLAIVGIRLVWGFIGTRHARFSNFVTTPQIAMVYVKEVLAMRAKRHIGHNPAGGLMIVLLLTCLALTGVTGLIGYGYMGAGPLAGILHESARWAELFEEVHEFMANLTLLLVAIHILGVLVESWLHEENLARAMLNGRKRLDQ